MAAEAATLTHCPTCGVKLHRTDLSLCAYCASPLRLGASAPPADDETARLLAKITQHPGYEAALRWTPIEPRVEARAARWRGAGSLAMLLAGASALLSSLRADGPFVSRPLTLAAAGWLAVAAIALAAAATIRRRALALALLRRPARVLDRRSETAPKANVGATTYYFQLRFGDGSEGDFRFPGRGTMYEPPTVGATGLAYTRGTELIEFKRF
jgi:hypothetical protein